MKRNGFTKAPSRGERVGVLDDDSNVQRFALVKEVIEHEEHETVVVLNDETSYPFWLLCPL